MRLLVDTHVLLAMLDLGDAPLRPDMKTAMAEAGSTTLASVASLWEIAIKHRLGKLPLNQPLSSLADRVSHYPGVTLIVVTPAQVLREVDPWPETKDLFDRLLLAIADAEQAQLLTTDAKLLGHPLAWRPA